jgi:hypothetical protein
MFVWRLLRNRLPTCDNLLRRNIIHQTAASCVAGCDMTETANHLFLECGTSLTLWYSVCSWLGLYFVQPFELRDHHNHFCYMAGLPRCTHAFLQSVWYSCVWVIWKNRNNCIFQNEPSDTHGLLDKVKCYSFLWLKAKYTSFSYSWYDWWTHPFLCMGVPF